MRTVTYKAYIKVENRMGSVLLGIESDSASSFECKWFEGINHILHSYRRRPL